MRARRTVAISISILLAVVSTSASQCEISCSLSGPRFWAASRTASAARSQGTHSHFGHSHCGHVAKPDHTIPESFESTSSCSNASCLETAVLSSPGKSQDRERIDRRPIAFASVLSLPIRVNRPPLQNPRPEGARETAVPLGALPINLRI